MFSKVARQLSRRAEWLLSGQYDRIVAEYQFPLPVYLDASRLIVRSADEAKAMLHLQRASCQERGVVALKPSVSALDLPRDGRFRIWVDWHELTLPVEGMRRSSAIYYCREAPAGFRIEMVNYTRLSMPDLWPQFAALSLSA